MTPLSARLRNLLRAAWTYVRAVSGDDAYERYVAHHRSHHAGEPMLNRKAHFDERQRCKWMGVSRC
jgi:uncharacterized short protein YbdD (DUF466 family)